MISHCTTGWSLELQCSVCLLQTEKRCKSWFMVLICQFYGFVLRKKIIWNIILPFLNIFLKSIVSSKRNRASLTNVASGRPLLKMVSHLQAATRGRLKLGRGYLSCIRLYSTGQRKSLLMFFNKATHKLKNKIKSVLQAARHVCEYFIKAIK